MEVTMGTRSTIHIQDDDLKTVASLYRQYDGYLEGMGLDIRNALNNGQVELRNGFSGGDKAPKQFNGMTCLGAYLIGQLKGDTIGNVYLTDSEDRQAYDYFIYPNDGTVNMRAESDSEVLYDGILAEFDPELIVE
jgi:hypothetical protein